MGYENKSSNPLARRSHKHSSDRKMPRNRTSSKRKNDFIKVKNLKSNSVTYKLKIITGSHDSTIKCWDIVAGRTISTLTNHKKSVRALTLHPKYYSMASASPDNIKEWKFPSCEFIQNLSGHNAILNALAVNSDNVLVSAGKGERNSREM